MGLLRGAFARIRAPLRTHAALGLRPVTAPVMIFLPLGFVLGPERADIITVDALAHLDAVISIGLGTLGVFIGIAVGTPQRTSGRMMAAATLEAALTILTVAAATYVLLHAWGYPSAVPYILIALALGLCASASSAPVAVEGHERAHRIAARVADSDDVFPIVVGGAVLALIGAEQIPALAAVGLSVGLGVAIAVSGWLLFERSAGAERDVFVLGTLALLGGSAAYLETSPLLAGLAAGWTWARTPGETEQVVARHLRKLQHPLVVLILIIAGATLQLSLAGIWLFAPYVVFRTAGKFIGGWMASRLTAEVSPSELGAYLVPPGVIGIAFALNILQVAPAQAGPVVFAVSAGALVSEILALLVTPGPPDPTPV
jgi:hypothetical protein